ncbi:MAG: phage tail protein I [Verrucomicrobium sp.]|nr:phage tail protein I [Verrucomicrobium sp.]
MSESLLPPNATEFEQDVETVTSRISDVPVPLRTLWNPDTCPAAFLPWLAWALEVDTWSSSWTDAQKRAVIKASVDVHRHKGTLGAVRRVLEPFGLSGAIREWWQTTPPGTPHTFTVTLAIINTPSDVQDAIATAVDQVKPVRSEMTLLTTQGFTATPYLSAIVRPCLFTRISGTATASTS